MSASTTLKKMAVYSAVATALCVSGQGALAHTRLQSPTITEGTRSYNGEVIGHGCHNPVLNDTSVPVVATSLVFPDGVDSLIEVDGAAYGGTLDEFIAWGNNIRPVQSDDVFDKRTLKRKTDTLGNGVGYSYSGGSLPGVGVVGLVPFRVEAVTFNEDSCAQSVTFQLAIADICKVTSKTKFNDEVLSLWTPAVGSDFDGPGLHGFNSPATLKITRTTALPATCGGVGQNVVVKPSAAQVNRDLPIPGYWPLKR